MLQAELNTCVSDVFRLLRPNCFSSQGFTLKWLNPSQCGSNLCYLFSSTPRLTQHSHDQTLDHVWYSHSSVSNGPGPTDVAHVLICILIKQIYDCMQEVGEIQDSCNTLTIRAHGNISITHTLEMCRSLTFRDVIYWKLKNKRGLRSVWSVLHPHTFPLREMGLASYGLKCEIPMSPFVLMG